jgi:hypothetical protein
MPIPSTEYRNHELRAYAYQEFPTHHNPFALGARRFTSVVRVSDLVDNDANASRYLVPAEGHEPPSAEDAIALAMEYGRNIVDGKVIGKPL